MTRTDHVLLIALAACTAGAILVSASDVYARFVFGAHSSPSSSRSWQSRYCREVQGTDTEYVFICRVPREGERAGKVVPVNRCTWAKVIRKTDGAKWYGCTRSNGFWAIPME